MKVLGGMSKLGIPALGCGGRYDAIVSLRPREKRTIAIEDGGLFTIQLEARTLGSFTVTVSRYRPTSPARSPNLSEGGGESRRQPGQGRIRRAHARGSSNDRSPRVYRSAGASWLRAVLDER
jgi:hypothetical protein